MVKVEDYAKTMDLSCDDAVCVYNRKNNGFTAKFNNNKPYLEIVLSNGV